MIVVDCGCTESRSTTAGRRNSKGYNHGSPVYIHREIGLVVLKIIIQIATHILLPRPFPDFSTHLWRKKIHVFSMAVRKKIGFASE